MPPGGSVKRKVVQHGPSTLTISLPTAWVKQHSIQKGDELEVEEHNAVLRVSPDRSSARRVGNIDARHLDAEMVKSLLAVMHKAGYDELNVQYADPALGTVIRDRVRSMLMGFEVVEQDERKCRIKTIAIDENAEFDHALRRCFGAVGEMSQATLEVLRGNVSHIPEALEMEDTINRLSNFCHRVINRGAVEHAQVNYLYLISWLLESIGDTYKRMLDHVAVHQGMSIPKQIPELCEQANALLDRYRLLFYTYSDADMRTLREQQQRVAIEIQEYLSAENGDVAILTMHLAVLVQYLYDCFGSTTALQHV